MRPIFGQPLDYDPSTLEIPQAHPDQSTLEVASRYRSGGGQPSIDDLVGGIIQQESGGDPSARGKAGEIGLAQIMPSTAAQYGIGPEALAHPGVNKMVAKRYLGDLLRKYGGNFYLALAAYNAGPGNVDRGHIPQSTREYVNRVMSQAGNLGGPGAPALPQRAPSLQQILSGQGPEDKYGPLGAQPFSALQAGDYFRPQETRQMAALATGGAGAEEEVPELSSSARAMVRRARAFGVDPANIATLTRRVRAGAMSDSELSLALKDLRARLPETGKTAAVIRKYAGDLPRDLLAEISKGVREGKLTLQQAKRMLKVGVAGVGAAALIGTGGEGTAEAGEVPPASSGRQPQVQIPQEFQNWPKFQNKSPETQQKMLDAFHKKSPEVQQGILQRMIKETKEYLGPWPRYMQWTEPVERYGGTAVKGMEEWLRSGGDPGSDPNFLARAREPTTVGQRELARTLTVGRNPFELATNLYFGLGGLVEKKLLQGGIEAVPPALRWMVPLVKARSARIGVPAAIGAVQGAQAVPQHPVWGATGGALLGGGPAAVGELGRGAYTGVARSLGEEGWKQEMTERVAGEAGRAVGGIGMKVEDMERLGTRGEIVTETINKTAPVRQRIYGLAARQRFRIPELTEGSKFTGDYVKGGGSLLEAERTLDQLNRASYATGGANIQKTTERAVRARELADKMRNEIVQQLNGIKAGLGDAWSRQRQRMGAAYAIKRLFAPKNKIIDLTTGQINQGNLLRALQDNWQNLQRNLGQDGANNLWKAATDDAKGAVQAVLSEPMHFSIHPGLPPGARIGPPVIFKPPNMPTWMNPPRAPFAFGAGALARHVGATPEMLRGDEEGQ